MPRAILVWVEDGSFRQAPVSETAVCIIGRASDCAAQINDATVSRHHAQVSNANGIFVIENLSGTNTAKINRQAIARPTPLADRDLIGLGAAEVRFYDLMSGDSLSCSFCDHPNPVTGKDCWYCGTSLVNAPTMVGGHVTQCRLVSSDGSFHDLHSGEVMTLGAGGARVYKEDEGALPQAPARIGLTRERAVLEVVAGNTAEVLVDNQPAAARQALQTGNSLQVEGHSFLVILRD